MTIKSISVACTDHLDASIQSILVAIVQYTRHRIQRQTYIVITYRLYLL